MRRLAVNLGDVMRNPPFIVDILLGNEVDKSLALNMDASRFDEGAIVFTCDLLTAASICDVLRFKDRRMKRHPTRVYLQVRDTWKKLSGSVDLTHVAGSRVLLNRRIIPSEKRIRLG